MREDMHKVLTEPARRGQWRWRNGAERHQLDAEELPSRESMRRPWKNRKVRRPRRNPLERFFKSRCGRLWNDVFSEICEGNRLDRFTKWELRNHIQWIVQTHIVMVDGRPQTSDGHRLWAGDFWVHPETGVLHCVPERPRRGPWQHRSNFKQISIDRTSKFVLVDGIWYRVEFAAIPEAGEVPVRDVVFKTSIVVGGWAHRQVLREWNAEIYAISKRQLGKRALARLRAEHTDVV